MNEAEVFEEDEISLFDLFEKLRAGWRFLMGGALGGLAVAGIAIMTSPATYEATALLQVAQVGQIGPSEKMAQASRGVVSSTPIEDPEVAAERMKSAAFQAAVLKTVGRSTTGSFSVRIPKTAPALVEVSAKAGSAEGAKQIVEVAIAELAARHAKIAEKAITRLTSDLESSRDRFRQLEAEQNALVQLIRRAGTDQLTQLSLMASLRVQKESEMASQRFMVLALEAALSPPNTQAAHALEEITSSDRPVSPKKGMILALGFLGGLLLGIMWVFVSDAWRQAAERRQVA